MVNRGGVGAVLARARAAVILVCLTLGGFTLLRHDISSQSHPKAPGKPAVSGDILGRLPLIFEPNQGQSAEQVKFEARANGYGLYLTDNEAVLTVTANANSGKKSGKTAAPAVVEMQFAGANHGSIPQASEQLPGHTNYFLGNDRSKWHTNIPQYARVRYRDLYSGVDLDFYGKQGRLEYDFEVNPGADPNQIALQFAGANHLQLAANGDLVISAGGRELRFQAPHVYQASSDGAKDVNGRFVLRGDRVGFALGEYDRSRTLVIDPVLTFSTFLGGGSESCAAIVGAPFVPHCPAIALDSNGRIYIAGATKTTSASAWPTPASPASSIGPLAAANGHVFVARISGINSSPTLDYLTFIGGEAKDYPNGLAVDSGFNAYVAGTTTSQQYPTANGFQLSPAAAGTHAFLTQLDSTGSLNRYSTYISGNGIDTASDLAVDSQGRAYVFGTTTSTSGFPITPGALQNASKATNQFFLTKVDAATAGPNSLLYSTYIGGSVPANGVALGGAVAVDSAFNVYVAGGTNFTDMPIVNAYQGASSGGTDLWVARLNAPISNTQQYTPSYETYLGAPGDTSQVDIAYGIATDATNTYVTGSTNSSKFSGIVTGLTPFQASYGGGASDAFVAQFGLPTTSGTTQGTVPLSYFSYLGGGGTDVGLAIATDVNHNARIAGYTTSGAGFPGTPNTFGSPGGTDAFFARIVTGSSTAATSSATTLLGGSNTDFATSTAVDPLLNSYIAGETGSGNFPVTANSLQGFTGTSTAFATELGPNTRLVSFACNPSFPINSAGCAPAPANPTVSPSPVGAGNDVTFTYSIYNQGDPVTGAVFTDTLSPNSFLKSIGGAGASTCTGSGTGTANCCTSTSTGTTCTVTLGTIPTSGTTTTTINGTSTTVIGSVEQVTVVVTATPPTPTGFPPLPAASINNGATISIPGPGCLKNCQVAQVATVNDFAIQGTPATVKVSAGNEATYTIQVQPSTSGAAGNIFPDSVSLSCGTLPANAQCAWSGSNPVPNLNNGAVTRILNIKTAPHTTTPASLFRTGGPLYALWLPIGGLALLGGVSRRRRWLLAGLLTILLGTISFLPACSSSPNTSLSGGTPAGTYTVNINATSGTATRTTSVQLIVQ